MRFEINGLGSPNGTQLGLDPVDGTPGDALTAAIQYLAGRNDDEPTKVGVFGYDDRLYWKVERYDSLAQTGVDEFAVVVRKPYDH